MKKLLNVSLFLLLPVMLLAQDKQDNVTVDNKKAKEKKGEVIDNPAIKKSKKEMDKQGAEWDKKKYKKRVKPGHNKGDKEDQDQKEEQKKAL